MFCLHFVDSFFFKFISLAAPDISCGTQALWSSCCMWYLYLRHVGSSFLTRAQTLARCMWECGGLATGPWGKSLTQRLIFDQTLFLELLLRWECEKPHVAWGDSWWGSFCRQRAVSGPCSAIHRPLEKEDEVTLRTQKLPEECSLETDCGWHWARC